MTSKNPLISVIIPTYNTELYLEEALESIQNQDYPNIEIIVVDDGSTDNTAEILKKYDVQYYYQKNNGVSSAMNSGFELAKGEYIASLDADDLWNSNKLSLQMKMFEEDSNLEIVFCHVKQFVCPKINLLDTQLSISKDKAIMKGFSSIAMLIKEESFKKIGNFNESYKYGDFIEWFGRAQDKNVKYTIHDNILAYRRIHKSNMTKNKADARQDYLRIVKEIIARKRED